MRETWTHLQCMNLIALPRYTFRQAFIKYRTPMIQFVKEDLFQKYKIEKIGNIILQTVKGMLTNCEQYPSISPKGKAAPLDVTDATRKISTSLKKLMNESSKQKNPSLAHHQTNVTLMENIVKLVVTRFSRPVISISSILYNFNEVRLRFKRLRSLYVSETIMELLSSVLVVGAKRCQFSVSFKGDCHLYTLLRTKCGKAMHEREYPIMILLQWAPRIILDHFGLGTSSWNDKVNQTTIR